MVPLKINDIESCSSLYDKYAPALYGIILKLAPDAAVADRVLEMSFVEIWGELNSYDVSRDHLFSAMLRTTLRVCKSEIDIPKKKLHNLFAKRELSKNVRIH